MLPGGREGQLGSWFFSYKCQQGYSLMMIVLITDVSATHLSSLICFL